MRQVVVCADDAGWNETSDEIIFRHSQAGQISAISMLVDGPNAGSWKGLDVGPACTLGLHFNLTWSPDSGSHGLGKLLLSAFARSLSRSSVEERLRNQLVRFETLYARPPDFIDGHQHVQILPGIREPLLQLLADRYESRERPLVRVPRSQIWRGSKASSLNWLGANRLDAEIRARQWTANSDFAGVYDLTTRRDYRERMKNWLSTIRTCGLIMAHPGGNESVEHASARAAEAAYFASQQWQQDRREANVCLIPFTADALTAAVQAIR